MDVHAAWYVRQGNDIDVVLGVFMFGNDSRRFMDAREAFAIAVDGGIDPVAAWSRLSAWEVEEGRLPQRKMISN